MLIGKQIRADWPGWAESSIVRKAHDLSGL